MANVTRVGNFQRFRFRGADKSEGMAADIHIAEGLCDFRHMASDTFAAGTADLVLGMLLDCCGARSVG